MNISMNCDGVEVGKDHPADTYGGFNVSEISESQISETEDDLYLDRSENGPILPAFPSNRPHNIAVAEKEQKWVGRSKRLLIFVLLIAVVAVSTAIYLILRKEEEDDFKAQFQNYANQIIAVSQSNAISSFEMIESFAVSITSYASDTNKTWPFVVIPDFAARADRVVTQAHASRFGFAPIVDSHLFEEWTNFTANHKIDTFRDDVEYLGLNQTTSSPEALVARTGPQIFALNFTDPFNIQADYVNVGNGPWAPFWQGSPIPSQPITNYDLISGERTGPTYHVAKATSSPILNFVINPDATIEDEYKYIAESVLVQPIFDKVGNMNERDGEEGDSNNSPNKQKKKMVGFVWVVINWIYYFQNLLPDNANGIDLVLKSSCMEAITYRINGLDAIQVGDPVDGNGNENGLGDVHDPTYDDMVVTAPFFEFDYDRQKIPDGICVPELTLHIYPSAELEDEFITKEPVYYALAVVLIFAFTTIVFIVYDYTVRRRQRKVMARLYRQDKIVSDMFPTAIRQRLYAEDSSNDNDDGGGRRRSSGDGDGGRTKNQSNDNNNLFKYDSKAIDDEGEIAELYPNVSLIFADISGFTAWSSAREPSQVFTLLETLYSRFDKIALRFGVFKVETVGDCWVGCAGLPEACDDHAVRIAKFARGILDAMDGLTRKLEVRLGPDTTDLTLRIGIHSGQVTAGVLRGTRSRFQLFGDAVNMCSRMESSSMRNHIQMSESTANLLIENGKGRWVKPREETVTIKGKGNVRTFWLKPKGQSKYKSCSTNNPLKGSEGMEAIHESAADNSDSDSEDETSCYDGDNLLGSPDEKLNDKTERLVQWNVEVLGHLLKQILAARSRQEQNVDQSSLKNLEKLIGSEGTVLEEFVPIISLPQVTESELQERKDPKNIELSPEVKRQLHSYVSVIASMYNSNPFHNFEHASHVSSSVRKLLTRITNVDSYGITNDPLTQFSVVFSACIHDADHPGVPNATLVKEKTRNARIYNEKSVAEQNSVDLAWEVLMENEFAALRACIYQNEDELKRFRQLVVNCVMATDIVDKELQALRKARWVTAFDENYVDATPEEAVNRKATIVIEHLIQASDVAHTMQHWHVYKQWNQRLFFEMYSAYKAGRAEKDPSEFWFKGELAFFDFYVIPLAKKLASCGVFGVSSHEYLGYAEANREEWAQRGEDMVEEYLALFEHSETRTEACSESSISEEEAV